MRATPVVAALGVRWAPSFAGSAWTWCGPIPPTSSSPLTMLKHKLQTGIEVVRDYDRSLPRYATLESARSIHRPSMGLLRRPLGAKSWRADDRSGPTARARIRETRLRLPGHPHISDISPCYVPRSNGRDAKFPRSHHRMEWSVVVRRSWTLLIDPAAIGDDDMQADHHSIRTDGPSGPPCGGRWAFGLVPQLEAGALGHSRLDHSLRCGSVCCPPGQLGL